MKLSYTELLDEASESGLALELKDNQVLTFRPLDALSGKALKAMLKLVDLVQDESVSNETKIDTIDQILTQASDNESLAKTVLEDMPLKIKMRVFGDWSGSEEVGNS